VSSYPKWLYHPTREAVVVLDEAAHKALGPGWVESPAEAVKPAEPPKGHGEVLGESHPADAEKHHKKAK
jgi:hypothetical protein